MVCSALVADESGNHLDMHAATGAVIHREISLTKALSVSLPNGYFTSLNETVSSGDKGHKAIRYIGEFF